MEDKFKRFKESLKRDKLVKQREELVAGLTSMTDEQKAERKLKFGILSSETTKDIMKNADQVISVERPTQDDVDLYFDSGAYQDRIDLARENLANHMAVFHVNNPMPLGLREAQERNGVADHGLGLFEKMEIEANYVEYDPSISFTDHLNSPETYLTRVKGDFKWLGDKQSAVVFVPNPDGVFSIQDPDNINEATKNFLDRKFPDVPYLGTDGKVVYEPKSIVEPELNGYIEALDKQAVELTNDFQVMLPVEPPKSSKLILNFSQTKQEEMTEKVEAYKESKERIIARDNIPEELVEKMSQILFPNAEIKGFEPEHPAYPNLSTPPPKISTVKEPTTYEEFVETKGFDAFPNNTSAITVTVTPIENAIVSGAVEKAKPKFGRARFAKKPLAEGEVAKNKINASKIEEHGIVFDSKIENFMYNLLIQENIRFEFQKEFVLQEGFVYMHENILPVKIIIDFFLLDYPVMADTKGMMMDHTKIKHKMLKKHLHDTQNEYRIVLPSSQKKCRELIDMLRNGFKLEEPLTEHAANARKAKLKNAGLEWVDGFWCKGGFRYVAGMLMQMPKYDFEEFLIGMKG